MGATDHPLSELPTSPSEQSNPWRDLLGRGWSHLEALDPDRLSGAIANPWKYVEDALGVRPARIDVASVRPVAGASSYTATDTEAEPHTDVTYSIVPPHLQVFICQRPAATGGVTLLVDGWQALDELKATSPGTFESLFYDVGERSFAIRWFGATVGMRHDNLVLAHLSSVASGGDEDELTGAVRRLSQNGGYRTRLVPGQVLAFNNHRMLHGRSAFSDPQRLLTKLHVWLCEPLPARPDLREMAERARSHLRAHPEARNGAPIHLLGIDETPSRESFLRAGIVQETLGAPEQAVAETARRLGLRRTQIVQWCAETMEIACRRL
jgi:hypothetical protein